MHVTEFHIVVVDDEPDVLEISRLAMRNFRVYGLPLRLHEASSKAHGIEVLESLTSGRPDISMAAVAMIDVVMETEHAGLELCDYIRNVMKNRCMQLFVRTGQPGVAPERTVLDRYDIQGYLAKAEATEDKLYTLVKAGVRENYFSALSLALQDLVHSLVPAASSRSGMAQALREWQRLVRLHHTGQRAETIQCPEAYFTDGEFIAGVEDWEDEASARRRLDELVSLPALRLDDSGDSYTLDGRDLLVQVAPSASNAQVHYVLRGTAAVPNWEAFLYHRYLRTFSALWKQAR